VDLHIADNKLRQAIEDADLCRRRYGVDMAKKLALRLASLRAANSLADFWPPKSGPERCHELIGDRKGTFSIDLKQPYRLLFTDDSEIPGLDRSDEQGKWRSITAINIVAIEDTHA